MLWNVRSGALPETFRLADCMLNAIKFSPDGRVLAIGCGDKSVRLLKLKD